MQVGRMVDRLVPTTLSIFVRLYHPRLAFVHEALVETHFCIKARSYHTMAFTLYTQPTLPGISHYNLLTSTSNIQSYIHKLLSTKTDINQYTTRRHLSATRCVGYDPSAMRTRRLGDTRKTRKDKYEGTGG